jgi:integrase
LRRPAAGRVTIAEYRTVWSERHTTRHTFASTLLAVGVSVPATAEYLGHSAGVLLATYAHLPPGDHDRARSAVEAAFADAGSRVTGVSGG